MARNLTDKDFDQVLADNRVVLVDFWAVWCGPCRAMNPVLEKVESEFPNVVVAKVDVDDQQSLAARLKVSGLPTFKLFVGGQEVAMSTGARPFNKFSAWLNEHLPEAV